MNNFDVNNKELFKRVSEHNESIETFQGNSLSFYKDAALRFRKNKAAVISLIFLVLIVLLILIGPLFGEYGKSNYNGETAVTEYAQLPPRLSFTQDWPILNGTLNVNGTSVDVYELKNIPDDVNFIFGTDYLGRDLWARTLNGAQISLLFGLIIAIIDITIGATVGGFIGYKGGKIDIFGQRIIEILGSIPFLIIVVLILMAFGSGLWQLILAMSLTGWIPMARIVRAQVLKLKEQEFVFSSRTMGTTTIWIIRKHLLPNTIGIIIIWLMADIPAAIFTESFLSFLGLGLTVPTASLGSIINSSRLYFLDYPYLFFIPAILLSLLMLSLNLIGDGLRDAFDPKMRGGNN